MRIFIVILIIQAGSPEKLYFFGRAFVTRILTPTHENPAMGFFGGGGTWRRAMQASSLLSEGGHPPLHGWLPWQGTTTAPRTPTPHSTHYYKYKLTCRT